ncbi:MAG: zinc ribbon domain-containing protein [Litorilinea sp.]
MSEVRRICAHCGEAVPLDGRYCASCGYDFETALPVQNSNLPVALGKAALPMLVGAAGLALRAGWKLAQSQWARDTARNVLEMAFNRAPVRAVQPPPPAPAPSASTNVENAAQKPRRTIRIRSTWAEGDANGVWRKGTSDQTIEIDD